MGSWAGCDKNVHRARCGVVAERDIIARPEPWSRVCCRRTDRDTHWHVWQVWALEGRLYQDAERRVAHLEHAIRGFRRLPPPIVSVRAVVERYLRDLRVTFGTNVDAARNLLSLALEKIVLHPDGQRLIAHFCGNLTAVLRLEPVVMGSVGAGRGI